MRSWSLTTLLQRLVKTGGRLVKHARYYWLRLAEGHPESEAIWQHAEKDRRGDVKNSVVIEGRGCFLSTG